MTTAVAKTAVPTDVSAQVFARIVEEGYGPGAWHGADLKAALADVTADAAFWRPAPARHNIAEIALHHAFCVRAVRARLTGRDPEPFVLEGEDWFELGDASRIGWPRILETVETEQRTLADAVAASARSRTLTADERFELVLGITCHAVYHAGQVQLVKRMRDGA